MSAIVPAMRPEFSTADIKPAKPVSAEHWGGMASTANYLQGHGAMVVPWCAIGATIDAGDTETFPFYIAPKVTAVERVWRINLRCSSPGGSAQITPSGGSTVTAYPTTDRTMRTTSVLVRHALTAKSASAGATSVAIKALDENLIVESMACYEQTRKCLDLNTTDYGCDITTMRPRQPIFDGSNESVAAVMDAYKNLDARRAGFFAWTGGESSPIRITSSSFVDLFPLEIPAQTAPTTPSSTSETLQVYVYAKVDDGNAQFEFESSVAGDTVTLSFSDTSLNWDGDSLQVATEDLTVADGRRSSAFEGISVRAKVVTASFVDVAGVSITRRTNPI